MLKESVLSLLCSIVTLSVPLGACSAVEIDTDKTFADNLAALLLSPPAQRQRHRRKLLETFPVESDWLCQDTGADMAAFLNEAHPGEILYSIISRNPVESDPHTAAPGRSPAALDKAAANLESLLDTYVTICRQRRAARLEKLRATCPQIVFLKNIEHGNAPRAPMSISTGPYRGRPFDPGASICLLDLSVDPYGKVETLLHDANGMIRDIDVSFDGRRILFVWKKSATGDDYHLYEMTVRDRSIRQITSEPGVADIQGRYLPDGILYQSTRCINVVVCNETIDTVNMYRCDPHGKNIKRLTYDQVSTQYPSLLDDGRILYTRWEYNDRGQIYPQGLFVMNPDGTGQSAVYGNNSYYPTSLIQARGVPNSSKLIAVLSGHHAPPCGKLALIDINRGQDEGKGITLLAPVRPISYERVDAAGQDDVLFQYPCPLSEDEYLVGFSLWGEKRSRSFGIYYMRSDGSRELLAWDFARPCRQPIPLTPRKVPRLRPSLVAPDKDTGIFYIDNIYAGQGLKGVKKGTVKRLRVIALEFRAAAVGISYNNGPAGSARVDTPISIGGAWDTKIVLGETEVYEDGSASFIVPARLPVYFQAIDENGLAVQSMRSWATLQPGETFSCIGCHETRNRAPRTAPGATIAQSKGPQALIPFYGPPRGFSYLKEIQPILDRHCVRCHGDHPYRPPVLAKKGRTALNLYCCWPAQYSRTNRKEALYYLPGKQTIGKVTIDWLTTGPKMRRPVAWRLFYRAEGRWLPVSGILDATNAIFQPPVSTDALKIEAVLADKTGGGIEQWHICDPDGRPIVAETKPNTFNLSGRKVYEDLSGRAWAESYLSLLRAGFRGQGNGTYHLAAWPNKYTNWISPQSGPLVLEPYSFGAARSSLIAMLRAGHKEVELSIEEMHKLCCWLDLAVPYCGEYMESNLWTDANIRNYNSRLAERRRLAMLEDNR